MIKFSVLGDDIFFDTKTGVFSLSGLNDAQLFGLKEIPDARSLAHSIKITSYTFCLDVSDSCNLRCDYCFNGSKSGKTMTAERALSSLDEMFKLFPNGEKYFIDLSGKGEPLLALKTVLGISDYCHKKQDEIRHEVLPQFVCNGTFLSPEVADIIQKSGILFGVSIDGCKTVHDKHRRTIDGKPTFDQIVSNVKKIKHHEYVGCACTLTKDVFPLLESVISLGEVFSTISYRPARGPFGIDCVAGAKWEREYDGLGFRLLSDIGGNDDRIFLKLMNGEDAFGRFLNRAFGGFLAPIRCDAGISRFSRDVDGNYYACPSMSSNIEWEMDKNNIIEGRTKLMDEQADTCGSCIFKMICGGQCQIEEKMNKGINGALCHLQRHWILIAYYLASQCAKTNPLLFQRLSSFSKSKVERGRDDPALRLFLNEHKNLSFSEGKRLYDASFPKY